MAQESSTNRKIVLNARPLGEPTLLDFRLVEEPIRNPEEGEVLLRTIYLSLDPYMRGRMNEGPSYAPPVELGAGMVGATVSRVVRSRNPRFREAELVLGYAGWQEYAISDGKELVSLGEVANPTHFLGILGMPGFTAYAGLLKIGQPKPGDTVVVAAASGAVGSVVGQIAKLKGARVVGIAGGAKKCDFVATALGFDACIDHRSTDFAAKLAAACPEGIDVYFENVGGTVLDGVLPLLNGGARIPLCGLIAHYNDTSRPLGPNGLPSFLFSVLTRRLKVEGFIVGDFYESTFDVFRRDMEQWIAQGAVKPHEEVVNGLGKAPEAFIGMLRGENFGKLVVKVYNETDHVLTALDPSGYKFSGLMKD